MTEGNAGNAPTNRVQAAQEPLTILLLDAQPLQLEPLTDWRMWMCLKRAAKQRSVFSEPRHDPNRCN